MWSWTGTFLPKKRESINLFMRLVVKSLDSSWRNNDPPRLIAWVSRHTSLAEHLTLRLIKQIFLILINLGNILRVYVGVQVIHLDIPWEGVHCLLDAIDGSLDFILDILGTGWLLRASILHLFVFLEYFKLELVDFQLFGCFLLFLLFLE